MKWVVGEEYRIWTTFLLLGPPIEAVVSIPLEQYVLPVPGLLGFYKAATFGEGLEHCIGNVTFDLPFSYVALPLSLLCGLIVSALRNRIRPERDVVVAALVGLALGTVISLPDWLDRIGSYQ